MVGKNVLVILAGPIFVDDNFAVSFDSGIRVRRERHAQHDSNLNDVLLQFRCIAKFMMSLLLILDKRSHQILVAILNDEQIQTKANHGVLKAVPPAGTETPISRTLADAMLSCVFHNLQHA